MSSKRALHENYSHDEELQVGSDRSFGVVFTIVFAIVGLWPLRSGADPRIWALGIAGGFLVLGLLMGLINWSKSRKREA